MKKLFLFVLAAVLVPAAAGAVTFTNLSGAARMTVTTTSISGNTLIRQALNFVDGTNEGIIMDVAGEQNVEFIEDHLTFTGANNDAQLIVQGNVLGLSNNRVSGPAAFTLNIPAATPPNGTQVVITGAARVSAVRSGRGGRGVRSAITMTLQPSSVVFNSYSSGAPTGTRSGDATIKVPALVKTFTNMSSATLPPGFGNITSL